MNLFDQSDLFSSGEPRVQHYDLPDATLTLYEYFFPRLIADGYYKRIISDTSWKQEEVTLYNKTHLAPRLTAWYGDAAYGYAGVKHTPLRLTKDLLEIKQKIEEVSGAVFNSVLLNYYRHGQDSMGWHRDNEKELGTNPVIGSVSFGETRPFRLRHKVRKDVEPVEILLHHGSFLLMSGTTQHHWEHMVPKTAKPINPRINLTYRMIG